ncbi:hypothetical protein GCM10011360_17910 [Primorskyibacter flagellatus]|uniref:Uncharacterized protein n=1 Tax=Primorskyibacter flagellatus TaxID=1387277 RepID=A0A917A744_9RHOB|nr:hypothetical protein [Primorskyibacter flagellatus]GGE30306.1 hypothetical protein GCM10011360_17910 [Primorskyibacter flagellatus]
MTFITPELARTTYACPLARVFVEKVGPNCDANQCIMWRWQALSAETLKPAVSAEMKRIGKGPAGHKEAVANVMADPESHGVQIEPTHGYCGLAGKPEV